MGQILSTASESGKTYAARKLCFATDFDVLKVCALFGTNDKRLSFDDRRAGLLQSATNYLPNVEEVIKRMGLGFESIHKFDGLSNALSSNFFLTFENGYYLSSGFTTVEEDDSFIAFDDQMKPTTNNYKYVFKKSSSGVLTSFFSMSIIEDKSFSKLEGLPYICLNESAPSIPKYYVYPRYNYFDKTDNTLNFNIRKLQVTLSKHLDNILARARSSLDYRKFMEFLNSVSAFSGYSMAAVEAASEFKMLSDEEVQDLKRIISQLSGLETIKASLSGVKNVSVKNGELFTTPSFLFTDLLRNKVFPFSAESIPYSMDLCIIDSITSAMYTGSSAALSGGINGDFLTAMQQSSTSKAILLYAPHSKDRDPLSEIDFSGKVNGSVFLRRDGPAKYLSDFSMFYTSRSVPFDTGDRDARKVLITLYDQRMGVVFGNEFKKNVKTGQISKLSSQAEKDSKLTSNTVSSSEFIRSTPGFNAFESEDREKIVNGANSSRRLLIS